MNFSNGHHRKFSPAFHHRVFTALSLFLVLLAPGSAQTQNQFNSGSTGVDGAFNPPATPAVQEVQLPENGEFNYTTFNIPAGVTIRYKPNSKNTPVTILATGDVTILGKIDISGGNGTLAVFGAPSPNGGGLGGPGGFNGGRGGFSFVPFFSGVAGDGPGGGSPGNCGSSGGLAVDGQSGFTGTNNSVLPGGLKYGSRSLVPLIGGSGGGGVNGLNGEVGGGGGGGGGAILIASSTTIKFSSGQARSEILAIGGNGFYLASNRAGGGGSGGAIRLIANTISGKARFDVNGGSSCYSGIGHGYIRIEAFNYNGFEPQANPQTTADAMPQPIISLAQPTTVNLPNEPKLTITSVGGINAPAMPKGSFGTTPDILLPTTLANPVTVALQAANIPVGTVVKVTVLPESAARTTVDSSPLAGAQAALTATANVNLPATGTSLITATASFELPKIAMARPLLIEGERVRRVEVAATFGGKSAITYITESGKRVSREME